PCTGKQVYAPRHRAEWLGKINEPGVHRRAEFYYQQLDALRVVRQEVRRDLLAESKKQKAWKRLCEIPSIGPIRAAVLLGILQTPHRFRTKRPLWNYGGLAIEMHSSADHRRVNGQLQRSRKNVLVRGLNRNCNHDLKNLFKGAAAVASSKPGPFQEFYTALVAKGMRPEMAHLTLARKIADRTDRMEERSVLRRPTSETTNSLSVFDRIRSILVISLAVAVGFSRHSGSRASLSWLVRRCVPRARSLTRDPRPSRITRKSYGPRVPDRTMVATMTNVLLCWFRNSQASLRTSDENR